jgi:hypothetical protein
MEEKELLFEAYLNRCKKIVSFILIGVELLLPPLIFAGSFEGSLDAGKNLGKDIVEDFSPENIDQTLKDRGLGSVNEITPRGSQASGQQGNYTQFYTYPGGMSGAGYGEAGEFVDESYQRRQKFDLSRDSVFGNQCLQRDSSGKCVMWSSSKSMLSNTYPDCQKVVIPQYGEVREETCTGELTSQTYDCETKMVITILTEEVQGPCDRITIQDREGQIFAVCRDYVDIYKVFKKDVWCYVDHNWQAKSALCSDCWRGQSYCQYCYKSCPQDAYVVSSESELPAGAEFLGQGLDNVYLKKAGDNWWAHGTLYHYYRVLRKSVIERVLTSFDSTCGKNFEKWLEECVVSDYQKCDSMGFNCVYLVKDGETTGKSVPIQCQNFASSMGVYQSQNCYYSCSSDYDECKNECTEGNSSCYEARTSCRSDCDNNYSLCEGQCDSQRNSCLSACGTNQTCRDGCQSNYNSCVSACLQSRNVCYGDCETKYQNCNICVSQCEEAHCAQECQTVTMDNYEICSLPDSSQGIRVNGTIVKPTPYRSYFTTTDKGVPITWQVVFGGSGVKEGLNDWWSKVKFLCEGESLEGCQALIDAGCVLYSQRCLDSDCKKYEFVYHCGDPGIKGYTVAYSCAGEIRCMGTDCVDASYEANTDFASAAAAIETLNQYRVDSQENRIFPGEAKQCQASPNNCCRKAGGGVSVGDYVNAARNVASLYSYATGGATATWTAYAEAFSYVLTGGEYGTLSGLLGETISSYLGTTSATLFTEIGYVNSDIAMHIGADLMQQGSMNLITVNVELISALATVATVITIALVVYSIVKFVYDWMFQCKKEDIITSSKLQLRLCHYVGSKKSKKLGVFTKKTNVYCCFNSILARIIHEQGRPQIGIGWGSADSPNCRGFTPEELASIDFSRIDFREYMQYVEYKTEISPEEMEEIANKIKQKYLQ